MHWLYLIFAWTFVGLVGWSIWLSVQEMLNKAKRFHQIPCANCQFFSHNYCLKCSVHPDRALTEAAIDCPDYFTQSNILSSS